MATFILLELNYWRISLNVKLGKFYYAAKKNTAKISRSFHLFAAP